MHSQVGGYLLGAVHPLCIIDENLFRNVLQSNDIGQLVKKLGRR